MPELPEVETIARGLAKRISGDLIESVWLCEKPEPFKSPPAEIAGMLEGSRIRSIHRMGKHIVLDLEPAESQVACQWIIHLGMTGRLLIGNPEAEIEKHTHALVRLSSGRELRFVDPRRFGRMWVVPASARFEAGGFEPLNIGFEMFVGLFRGRKTPIKSALLNQKLLRGIGNIYADESLFRAGIRPRRRAATLTRRELQRLFDSVQQVLNEAISAGGSSVSDYVDSDGEQGFFQLQHRVYGREGEPCLVCGVAVKRVVLGGRGTHYCSKCQK